MTGEGIKLGIEIFVFIAGGLGIFYKNKYDVKKNSENIDSLKSELDEHCKQTPLCMKKFEDITLNINKLSTEDKLKEQYQTQIVEHLIKPIIKEMSDSLKEYTDVKTSILTKEIESLRMDSNIFKQEIKQLVKDMTVENSKNIERLIEVLKK